MKEAIIQKIKTAPTEPGVYTFFADKKVLYIGKAANLKNRLKSYLKITDLKTKSLHEEADNLEYTVLRSDIEALIEESRLIKSLKPKYNILWMDDKSYHYVYFTKDKFPKVFIAHAKPKPYTLVASRYFKIGPFTDGGALRTVLKILRRSFPYCACFRAHLRDCLNFQIGLCLGVCCQQSGHSLIRANETIKQYRKNIKTIKAILTGKRTLRNLTNEQDRVVLENIAAHKDFVSSDSNLIPNAYSLLPFSRIECYDNSNFAGKEAVGAMTVLVKREPRIMNDELRIMESEWVADKNQWRKFKIKNTPTRDDPRMIGEVLERRLNHPEWPYPDLIVIDGGITQYRAAKRVLDKFLIHNSLFKIQLVSYAKPQRKVIGMAHASRELQELIERIIYQTHNFVIRYHRQVRSKAMFDIIK